MFLTFNFSLEKGTWYCGIAYGIISWLAYLTWNFKRLHVKYIVHKFDFLSNSIFAHFYFLRRPSFPSNDVVAFGQLTQSSVTPRRNSRRFKEISKEIILLQRKCIFLTCRKILLHPPLLMDFKIWTFPPLSYFPFELGLKVLAWMKTFRDMGLFLWTYHNW